MHPMPSMPSMPSMLANFYIVIMLQGCVWISIVSVRW